MEQPLQRENVRCCVLFHTPRLRNVRGQATSPWNDNLSPQESSIGVNANYGGYQILIQEGKSRLNKVVGIFLLEFPWIDDLSICPSPNRIFKFQHIPFVRLDPLCLGSGSVL